MRYQVVDFNQRGPVTIDLSPGAPDIAVIPHKDSIMSNEWRERTALGWACRTYGHDFGNTEINSFGVATQRHCGVCRKWEHRSGQEGEDQPWRDGAAPESQIEDALDTPIAPD